MDGSASNRLVGRTVRGTYDCTQRANHGSIVLSQAKPLSTRELRAKRRVDIAPEQINLTAL